MFFRTNQPLVPTDPNGGNAIAGLAVALVIGHFLGLEHCPSLCGPNNFMEPAVDDTQNEFTPEQVTKMKQHCFVKP